MKSFIKLVAVGLMTLTISGCANAWGPREQGALAGVVGTLLVQGIANAQPNHYPEPRVYHPPPPRVIYQPWPGPGYHPHHHHYHQSHQYVERHDTIVSPCTKWREFYINGQYYKERICN